MSDYPNRIRIEFLEVNLETSSSASQARPGIGWKEIDGGIELDYGQMYECPPLSFDTLKQLGEFFGTEDINVDEYNMAGCDTCDFGSHYAHQIQVRSITKNDPRSK